MFKDPNENRLQVKIPLGSKIEFLRLCKELDLKESELIVLLINNGLLLEVETLTFFRKSLKQRIKKGVGRQFIQELLKLKNDIDIYTKLL